MSKKNLPLSHSHSDFEILIVDDDRIVRLLHRRNLENLKVGYPISEHMNGQHALEYLREKKNSGVQFLILLDINMPIMDGWQFLQECHKGMNQENIFTVMLTSSTNKNDKEKALSFPQVIEFLEKPFLEKTATCLASLIQIGHFFGSSQQPITGLA